VTAQLVPVGLLSFVNFFKSLYDVMLGFGEIWVLGGVNVCFRPLRQSYSHKYQAYNKDAHKVTAMFLHDFTLLESDGNETQSGQKPGGEVRETK